jgi:hypothetical protein
MDPTMLGVPKKITSQKIIPRCRTDLTPITYNARTGGIARLCESAKIGRPFTWYADWPLGFLRQLKIGPESIQLAISDACPRLVELVAKLYPRRANGSGVLKIFRFSKARMRQVNMMLKAIHA